MKKQKSESKKQKSETQPWPSSFCFCFLLSAFLHESPLAELAFDERVRDRGHDHSAHTERGLADENCQEDLPGLRVGLAADDARVDEVLEFVDDDEKRQRRDRRRHGDAQRQD